MTTFTKKRDDENSEYATYTITGVTSEHEKRVIIAWFELHCESVEIKSFANETLVVEIVHVFNSHLDEPFATMLQTLDLNS